MTELIIPSKAPELSELKTRRLDQAARKAVMALLNRLGHGRITIVEDHQQCDFGEPAELSPLQVVITVHHPQFYSRVFFGGSIGAAEAYMDGLWTADDLTTVMRILALNQKTFADMEKGLARLTAPIYKLYHFLRKNTRSPHGSLVDTPRVFPTTAGETSRTLYAMSPSWRLSTNSRTVNCCSYLENGMNTPASGTT